MIQDLRECAKTNRRSGCDGRGRRAVSTGQPFGTLAATAALPTPPPPRRPTPTTTATTRSQGDVTAAPICCQPAWHVTGGRQSDCVTISKPAPGCGNHNIIRSSLSRCKSSSPPPPTAIRASSIEGPWSWIYRCFWVVWHFINRQQPPAEVIIPSCLTCTQD